MKQINLNDLDISEIYIAERGDKIVPVCQGEVALLLSPVSNEGEEEGIGFYPVINTPMPETPTDINEAPLNVQLLILIETFVKSSELQERAFEIYHKEQDEQRTEN